MNWQKRQNDLYHKWWFGAWIGIGNILYGHLQEITKEPNNRRMVNPIGRTLKTLVYSGLNDADCAPVDIVDIPPRR